VFKNLIVTAMKMMASMNAWLLPTMMWLDTYLTIFCRDGFVIYRNILVLQYSIAVTGGIDAWSCSCVPSPCLQWFMSRPEGCALLSGFFCKWLL
jgi:hypothetical protein